MPFPISVWYLWVRPRKRTQLLQQMWSRRLPPHSHTGSSSTGSSLSFTGMSCSRHSGCGLSSRGWQLTHSSHAELCHGSSLPSEFLMESLKCPLFTSAFIAFPFYIKNKSCFPKVAYLRRKKKAGFKLYLLKSANVVPTPRKMP